MSEKKSERRGLTHNPLGIIGLFLALVEGIASIVVINSNLGEVNNRILVIFIVAFPLLVMFVFYKLVTEHHHKLYSPKDYKNEDNFKEILTYDVSSRKFKSKLDNDRTQNIHASRLLDNKFEISELNAIKNVIQEIKNNQEVLFDLVDNQDELVRTSEINNHLLALDSVIEVREKLNYSIKINDCFEYGLLIEEMKSNGYYPEILESNDEDNNEKDCEAIWIGKNLPLDYAKEVIITAKRHLPVLKYIEFSYADHGAPDYVHDQIFIGGASSTAKERNLKPLSIDDFNIISLMDNIEELHNFFR